MKFVAKEYLLQKGKYNADILCDWFGFIQSSKSVVNSVTRLGDLLDFGQVFKVFGSNKFAQKSHILSQFL